MARHELTLVYQPEFLLPGRRIVAVEALVRWEHPRRGVLGPDAFIAVAERSGSIVDIGRWVLDESVNALARVLHERADPDLMMRVNVSPTQLDADGRHGVDVVQVVAAALAATGVAGTRLCLELTESGPLDIPATVATLERLRRLGVTSALDDLGSGFGSLGRLRALPVDDIKLDRSLVAGIDSDARARAIVAALVDLARGLRLGVVAEGVSGETEIDTLVSLGCHRVQGHYLSPPLTEEALLALLRDGP